MNLKECVEAAYEHVLAGKTGESVADCFQAFMAGLNSGTVRAAEKRESGWIVNGWVKKGILLGFRTGEIVDMSIDTRFPFRDKHTFPLKTLESDKGIRIVPGGSSVRDGVYLGARVTCMPPMYVNVGAYVDEDTMIDSHALVGSCAQIGKRVHLSAASQIGGVLEPIGSLPVIVEDDVLVGGNCGIYEGVVLRKGAVIGAGTVLTGSMPVYDAVNERILRRTEESALEIPENAVVVSGTRPLAGAAGEKWGLSVYTPVIIKYRDEKTSRSTALEEALR